MNIEVFIGYIGAGLITVCLVPQVYTTYSQQNTKNQILKSKYIWYKITYIAKT